MPSGITEAQRASGVNARITMGLSTLHSYIYVWLFFFFIFFILRPSLLNTIAMPVCNKSNLNSLNMWHVLLWSVFHLVLHLVLKIPPWDDMVLVPFYRQWNLKHRGVVCSRSESWELNSVVSRVCTLCSVSRPTSTLMSYEPLELCIR